MIYLLSPTAYDGVHSLPMIDFESTVDSIDLSHIDILLFTSKQAVTVADRISPVWKNYPCIAVGSATKEKIEALGGTVIYMPQNFYGQELAQDLVEHFRDQRVLYLRPQKVAFDMRASIDTKLAFSEQIIYRTICKRYTKQDKPPQNSVIIFTSPSTITCFVDNFGWDESYTAVVIGETTQKSLPKPCKYVISEQPLITSCIKKAKEITENSDI